MIKIQAKIFDGKEFQSCLIMAEGDKITLLNEKYNISKEGQYYFNVLQEIRKILEEDNVFILINANRIDVYPSGMALMGTLGYVNTMGKKAALEDLVDIFDETDKISLLATVSEQRKYHIDWINSLR